MNRIKIYSLIFGTSLIQLASPNLDKLQYCSTEQTIEHSLEELDEIQYLNGYEDTYQLEELLNNYTYPKIEVLKHQNTNLYDSNQDTIKWERLYQTIKKNNQEYLKTSEEDYYEEFTEPELMEILSTVREFITQIEEERNLDNKELACKLEELTVLKEKRIPYVDIMFTGELDWHTFKLSLTEESDKDYFKIKVAHEITHLLQAGCPDVQKNTIQVSVWQEPIEVFNPDQPSSLRTRTIDECVAYIVSQSYHPDYPIDFPDMTNFNLLQFAMLPKEDFVANETIIDLSLTKNQEGFYQLFKAETSEEKKQVHEIMHTMDTLDFYDQSLYDNYPESENKITEMYTLNSLNLAKYLMANLIEREQPLPKNALFYLLNLYRDYNLYTLNVYIEELESDPFIKDYFVEEYQRLEDTIWKSLEEIYQDKTLEKQYYHYEYNDEDLEGLPFYNFLTPLRQEVDDYNEFKQKLLELG